MRNLNLLFYKEYYQKLGTRDFQKDVVNNNKALLNARFDYKRDYAAPVLADCQSFVLKLAYPGLLIGTGYPHGVGKLEKLIYKTKDSDDEKNSEDISLGFFFDYVTGQPVIPGSSVKGVLRSHFKYHSEAVTEILKGMDMAAVSTDTVKELEKAIFDNSDVFFDAVICKGDAEGRMLGFDYITPHSSVAKNPVPIRIIKVLPEVQLEFRFKISDKKEIDGVTFTAENLKELFKELILLFGAGAKTNVGYGVFVEQDAAQPTNAEALGSSKNAGKETHRETNRKTNTKKKKKTQKQPSFDDALPEWKKKLKSWK